MYIDIVPNRNSPPAILLRESVREGGKIRKRTIANISHWPAERVEAVRRALRGEFDDKLPMGKPTSGPVFGVLYALKKVADDLGITRALGRPPKGKLEAFLVLAGVAHQGSRLSAVRWARNHAVGEVLGVEGFDEEDLYEALDDLARRQARIELAMYRRYGERGSSTPLLFLYEVTSSYLEGEKNELAEYGYNRDGKRAKKQIVIGILTDGAGEPMAVRVFAGNTSDSATVADPLEIVKEKFQVQEVVFVGDRGMIKAKGKEKLSQQGMRYITALTDPQIRKLLKREVIQLGLFEETICEVEAAGVRYILRKNEAEGRKVGHRLADKLKKLDEKARARNEKVAGSARGNVQAGVRGLNGWIERYKLSRFATVKAEGKTITVQVDAQGKRQALELAGCYLIETDVPKQLMDAQTAHDRYKDLAQVERDIRTLKTGLLEVRPIFVRKESRTRGHVLVCMLALKLSRELERRLQAVFKTTDSDPHTVTLKDALEALGRLCLQSYSINETTHVTQIPTPDAPQQQILEALKVPAPG